MLLICEQLPMSCPGMIKVVMPLSTAVPKSVPDTDVCFICWMDCIDFLAFSQQSCFFQNKLYGILDVREAFKTLPGSGTLQFDRTIPVSSHCDSVCPSFELQKGNSGTPIGQQTQNMIFWISSRSDQALDDGGNMELLKGINRRLGRASSPLGP